MLSESQCFLLASLCIQWCKWKATLQPAVSGYLEQGSGSQGINKSPVPANGEGNDLVCPAWCHLGPDSFLTIIDRGQANLMNSSYSFSRQVVKRIPKHWFHSLGSLYFFFYFPLCEPFGGGGLRGQEGFLCLPKALDDVALVLSVITDVFSILMPVLFYLLVRSSDQMPPFLRGGFCILYQNCCLYYQSWHLSLFPKVYSTRGYICRIYSNSALQMGAFDLRACVLN